MERCTICVIILLSMGQVLSFHLKRSIDSNTNKVKHKQYHLYPTRVNWTEASVKCISRGMDLVSILSKEENDEVISAIKEAGQGAIGFWTSASRLNTAKDFHWGNGKPVTFTDWENGKPDRRIIDGEEELCIEIKGFNTFKWNDNFCTHELYYICEAS